MLSRPVSAFLAPFSPHQRTPLRALLRTMEKPRVLCAIDFGTTFTGFAFCKMFEDDAKIFQWCEERRRASACERMRCAPIRAA